MKLTRFKWIIGIVGLFSLWMMNKYFVLVDILIKIVWLKQIIVFWQT